MALPLEPGLRLGGLPAGQCTSLARFAGQQRDDEGFQTHQMAQLYEDGSLASTESLAELLEDDWLDGALPGPPAAPHAPPPPPSLDALAEQLRRHVQLEAEIAPRPHFLEGRDDELSPGMRLIVVSWMLEVAEEFGLQQETLHSSVLLFDRFCSIVQDVPRCVLQLLACGCILLAAKDSEVQQPTVQQLCAVAAHHFQAHDLLRTERIILDVMDFRLCAPSGYVFLHLLAQATSELVTPRVLSLAMLLVELSMLDYGSHAFSASARAAAALLLAQLSLGEPERTPAVAATIAAAMGGPAHGAAACISHLLRLQRAAYSGSDQLLAPLKLKFEAGVWCCVATAPPLHALPPLDLVPGCGA